MSLGEAESDDLAAVRRSAAELAEFRASATEPPTVLANEFAEVLVQRVTTRNGMRLLVESPKSGQWVTLDPLELEALTWQNAATLSAMVGHPFAPLIEED